MIPAMTPEFVHNYLYQIGCAWKNEGVAIELGSWFGATAVPLLRGLQIAGYDRKFYAYDRWKANMEQVRKAKEQGVRIKEDQDLLPFFLENAMNGIEIVIHKGNISKTLRWKGIPIEICIFDAPKQNPVFEHAVRQLGPSFVPGAIWGLLDYHWWRGRPTEQKKKNAKVSVRFVKRYSAYFEMMQDWGNDCACAFFIYKGGLDWNTVRID